MIDKFAEVIVKKLRFDMNELADVLANNRSKTIEDYRYTCGVIQGLGRAEEYVKDLAKQQEESDEG